MIHREIKRFEINVDFRDDSDIIRIKNQYENLLSSDMRSKGYLKILDLDPAFSIQFSGESWNFIMSIYGMYVGKRKAEEWEGISQWKLIPRIRRHTSSLS